MLGNILEDLTLYRTGRNFGKGSCAQEGMLTSNMHGDSGRLVGISLPLGPPACEKATAMHIALPL